MSKVDIDTAPTPWLFTFWFALSKIMVSVLFWGVYFMLLSTVKHTKHSNNLFLLKNLFLVLLILSVAACSSDEEGASEEQISNAFALRLPTGVEVEDVEILVSENMGTQIEPNYRARSRVELEITEDFYISTGQVLNREVVRKTHSDGDTITGILITSSRLRGERWVVNLDKVEVLSLSGKAESQFGENNLVVEGTREHTTLVAEEIEIKRLADEAAANHLAELRSALTGIWIGLQPAFLSNDVAWTASGGGQLGIQITFDEGQGDIGRGTGIIYNFANPVDEIIVPISFNIDVDENIININFTQSFKHGSLNFYIRSYDQLQLTLDGKLAFNSDQGDLLLTMEKDGAALASRAEVVTTHKIQQQVYEDLMQRHGAVAAEATFSRLPLPNNTYGTFFVVGSSSGDIWGDEIYTRSSVIAVAAVHQGILKAGQVGVIKISKHQPGHRSSNFESVSRNGITSKQDGGSYHERYTIDLVEALPLE